MTFNWRNFHIGAVSLVEIMMIFFIIGIVTVAGMSLNKPKQDYMTRIALYSAFVNLQNATLNIASEGHIGFTTEINNGCFEDDGERYNYNGTNFYVIQRDGAGGACKIWQYPGLNTQLPAVVARRTLGSNVVVDEGLDYTAYASITVSALQQKFKYLQSGFCQRLASIYKLEDYNISCAKDISDDSLIDDSVNIPSSFRNLTPQLYLPNGQVVYMGKYLYNNFDGIKNIVGVEYGVPTAQDASHLEDHISESSFDAIFDDVNNLKVGDIQIVPNEFRLRLAKMALAYAQDNGSTGVNEQLTQYAKNIWRTSKDYFNIYIDINGKMANDGDTGNGPDRLNHDVFLFHVYRDGAVRPAYETGFPKNYLLARIMVKQSGEKRYSVLNNNPIYAMQPITNAGCYANTVGVYSSVNNGTDYTGICGSIQPLSTCINQDGNQNCRVFINKPSFIIKKFN